MGQLQSNLASVEIELVAEILEVIDAIHRQYPDAWMTKTGIGSGHFVLFLLY